MMRTLAMCHIKFSLISFICHLAQLCSLCRGNVISVTVQTYFCPYLPFLGMKVGWKPVFHLNIPLSFYIWSLSQIKNQNVSYIVNKQYLLGTLHQIFCWNLLLKGNQIFRVFLKTNIQLKKKITVFKKNVCHTESLCLRKKKFVTLSHCVW